uniref:hypothetical protein n=1 Tax=Nocardia sp. 107 TaxID=373212 RepID=UPI00186644D2|nr:hypothetical protein [Nocardia sp. 107]
MLHELQGAGLRVVLDGLSEGGDRDGFGPNAQADTVGEVVPDGRGDRVGGRLLGGDHEVDADRSALLDDILCEPSVFGREGVRLLERGISTVRFDLPGSSCAPRR